MDWIDLACDREGWRDFVKATLDYRDPWNVENSFTVWGTVSFSRRTLLHVVSQINVASGLPSRSVKIKINKTIILLLSFFMRVKGGVWQWERELSWECSKMGCRGGYFGLRGARQQRNTEDYILKGLMIRNPCQYYSSDQIKNSVMGGKCKIYVERKWPPLWSSGQSFWLQIQRSRVQFPALPDFLSSNGSGTGPLSLVRSIEELLE